MRIACPACNAAYQVPDDQLAVGRVVRCARCGTDWAPIEAVPDEPADDSTPVRETVEPPAVGVESALPEVVEPVAMPRRVIEEEIPIPRPPVLPPPVQRRAPVLLIAAWIVSVGVVGAGVAGLYLGREQVMRVWPPSIRAYAAAGLAGPSERGE